MELKEVIKNLEELRNDCAYYEQIETKDADVTALSAAIEILKRTAQEVPVQEQSIKINLDSLVISNGAIKLTQTPISIIIEQQK